LCGGDDQSFAQEKAVASGLSTCRSCAINDGSFRDSPTFIVKGADNIMEPAKKESVEVICPRCRYTQIVTLPMDDLPRCPQCKTRMSISELLDEGKSY